MSASTTAAPVASAGNQAAQRAFAATSTQGLAGGWPAALPPASQLAHMFGGDVTRGVRVDLGVAAPGGRSSARAAANLDTLQFRDPRPPASVLVHELAHVAQARRGAAGVPRSGRAALEAEAEAAARQPLGTHLQLAGSSDGSWLYDDPPRGAADLRRALYPSVLLPFEPWRVLAILSENATPPERMARLRADYGANFFHDLREKLDGSSWGAARAYLGAQLTLAELIQTHTGRVWDDERGIFDALDRWPDADILRMIEEDVAGASLLPPAPAAAPAASTPEPAPAAPAPARATWPQVTAALAAALDSDEQYRAVQMLLSKAERARAARPATSATDTADANVTMRVRYAFSRIELAERSERPRDAYLAVADLNAAQRALLLPMLDGRSWPNLGGAAATLRGIAAEPDDAAALQRALRAAADGSGEISPTMLRHAAGRAGTLITRARARVDLPPASLSPEDLAARNAEVTALERQLHDAGLVHALYFASPESGAETLGALGVPPQRIAALTVNRVENFAGLLAWMRSIPAANRLEVTHSIWYQAKITQILGINPAPSQLEVLCAAIYEDNPELADTDVGRDMQALLTAYDIEQRWAAEDRVAVWTALSRMPEERRTRLAAHPRMTALVARLAAGTAVQMVEAGELRRALAGEADALLRQDALRLTVRGGRITFVIADPRAYIQLVNNDPAAQAELRRGLVVARRRADHPEESFTPEDLRCADRYEALHAAIEAIDDPAMDEALRNAAFGEVALAGAGGPQTPTSEADFMHLRLEDRVGALRTGGSTIRDAWAWEGTTVDQSVTEFRMLYGRIREGGISPGELAQLADLYYRAMNAIDVFAPGNRSFASSAAMMAAAVAGAIVVTVASGGTLGPVAIGALASFAGAAAAGVTGYAIRGESSTADVLTDVSTGAVEGAVAVASAAMAARIVHGATLGRPAAQAVRMASGNSVRAATGGAGAVVAESIIDGAIGGASGELFQTAIDESTWNRGVASAFASLLAAIARGAAFGAGGGLIGGAIGLAIRRVVGSLGASEAQELGRLLQQAGIANADRLSTETLEAIAAANRLARAGDIDGAQAALRGVRGLVAADAAALESVMRRMHMVRAALDVGEVDASRFASRITEVDEAEFLRRATDRRAHAVVSFEGGEPHVYVRRGSPPSAVREEIEHLLQWHGDPVMRARMAEVAGVTDEAWRGMAAAERVRIARESLIVEADAQRRILARVEGRARSGDALAEAEWLAADEALFDLNRRIRQLQAALDRPEGIDLRALRLDTPTPPQFYATVTPGEVAAELTAAQRATLERFEGRSASAASVQRELRNAGYVLHERNGRVFRVQRPPEGAVDLPHLSVGADGRIAQGRAGWRSHEDLRADAEIVWRAEQDRLARLQADVSAGRLRGAALADARTALRGTPLRNHLRGLVESGAMNEADAGLLLVWANFVEDVAQRMERAPSALRAVSGLPSTAGGMTDAALSTFRSTLREEVAQFVAAIRGGRRRMEVLHQILEAAPDNRTRGELFTAFRQRLWAAEGSSVTRVVDDAGEPVSPSFDFPGFGTSGRRTADDLVDVAAGHGTLPRGRYAVEDKTGAGAFSIAQAQDYARTTAPRRGLRRSPTSPPSEDLNGIVYVFSTPADAQRALAQMEADALVAPLLGRARGGIHVAHYGVDGSLVFSAHTAPVRR